MNFDVWKQILVLGIVPIILGLPTGRHVRKFHVPSKRQSITKRVEIASPHGVSKNAMAERRQSVIHAGVDYGAKDIVDETAADEFENLGKITDFSGKVVKSSNSVETKTRYKDEQPSTKDIIERMKELQDNLFRRGGSKELAAKLKLMEPEIASAAKAVQASTTANKSDAGKDTSKVTDNTPKSFTIQFPSAAFPIQLPKPMSPISPVSNATIFIQPLPQSPAVALPGDTRKASQSPQSLPQIVAVPETPPNAAASTQSKTAAPPVPQSSVYRVPQTVLQAAPQIVPQIVPQTAQQVVPQAAQQVVPQAAQQVVPQAAQQVVPQAAQQIVPQTVPQIMPFISSQHVPTQQVPTIHQQSLVQNVPVPTNHGPEALSNPPDQTSSPGSKSSLLDQMVKSPVSTEKAESRKIIPEDVVNKIIEKFQELKKEAKNFAILEKGKVATTVNPPTVKPESEHKEAVKVETSSPYATIGPAKDNEELKNLTSNSNSMSGGNLQSSEMVQSPNLGPVIPASSPPQQPMTLTPLAASQNPAVPPEVAGNPPLGSNTQGNVPMMFIKTGQVLVPIFGNQNSNALPGQGTPSPIATAPQPSAAVALPTGTMNQFSSALQMPQSSQPETVPVPSSAAAQPFPGYAPQVPQAPVALPPAAPVAPDNSQPFPQMPVGMAPQQFNQDATSRCCIPGQFPSMDNSPNPQMPPLPNQLPFLPSPMNQPGPPGLVNTGMLNNLPALPSVPSQMMGGVVNAMPQQMYMPQSSPGMMYNNQQSMPMTGAARGYSQQPNSQPPQSTSQYMPNTGNGLGPEAVGSSMMKSPAMNIPDTFPPTVNQLVDRPEDLNNFQVMQKEKDLAQAALNDISDPVQPLPQIGNVSPDQLLDIADAKSNMESISPDSVPGKPPNKVNPDVLLDRIQGEELRGGLAGPGDPSKDIAHMKGSAPPEPRSPFAGTTPDDLLDLLSSKKKGSFADHNRNFFSMTSDYFRPHEQLLSSFNSFARDPDRRRFSDNLIERSRYDMQPVGTSGMQSVGAMPSPDKHAGFDPSVADIVEPRASNRNPSDLLSQYIAHHRTTPKVDNSLVSDPLAKSVSVMSDDVLQFEHSRKAIDSDDMLAKFNQEQAETRQHIRRPSDPRSRQNNTGKPRTKTVATSTLTGDNIEVRVNGQKLTDNASLRSKVVRGSVVVPKGKTLMTKGPIRVELSHSDDVDHTKVVNIVTASKFNVTDSRRNRIHKP